MEPPLLLIIPLLTGYLLDLLLGDPAKLPHPVRVFGNAISMGEKKLNKGGHRFVKGMLLTLFLCGLVYLFFHLAGEAFYALHPWLYMGYAGLFVFYGLANKGLIKEGTKVFRVLEKQGTEAGRKQLSRIVGRDTSALSPQQIRLAVLETMSENLSDGVIAPLFWYAIGGIPGMMTYKMINTLDSMTGYRNERFEQFGKFAARLDDVANFVPARLTAILMVQVSFSMRGFIYIFRYGNRHKSPNAGYPEAALAGILNCRLGGPNVYHGQLVEKPFIGKKDRPIRPNEIKKASRINHASCLLMIIIIVALKWWWQN